jgi:hypothetical protein
MLKVERYRDQGKKYLKHDLSDAISPDSPRTTNHQQDFFGHIMYTIIATIISNHVATDYTKYFRVTSVSSTGSTCIEVRTADSLLRNSRLTHTFPWFDLLSTLSLSFPPRHETLRVGEVWIDRMDHKMIVADSGIDGSKMSVITVKR